MRFHSGALDTLKRPDGSGESLDEELLNQFHRLRISTLPDYYRGMYSGRRSVGVVRRGVESGNREWVQGVDYLLADAKPLNRVWQCFSFAYACGFHMTVCCC
jgi:hypothetical protein